MGDSFLAKAKGVTSGFIFFATRKEPHLRLDAAFVGRRPLLNVKGSFVVGQNFRMKATQFRTEISVEKHGALHIGDDVFVNQGVTIYCSSKVHIGDRVLVGDLTCIYDTNFHEVAPGEGVGAAPVTVEDDVWIGRGVTVLPGVTIGKGSVVAASSVVTKDVLAGVVVAGNPAKIVRSLNLPSDFRRQR